MVFEKFETWTFDSPAPPKVYSASWEFWGQRGYQLTSAGPVSFRGRSYQSKLGIHRVVTITVLPSDAGSSVQINFRADIRADVAAGGVVVAILLLPVAAVGAAISWHEYERDWSQERWDYWNYLTGKLMFAPGAGLRPPPPPGSPLTTALSSPPPPPSAATSQGAPASSSPTAVSSAVDPASASGRTAHTVPANCPRCGAPCVGDGRFCASCGASTLAT